MLLLLFVCLFVCLFVTLAVLPQDDHWHTPDYTFKLYDKVETFVMFIGHGRSGHSIVGSLLDAHPEVIIAHEYNILGNWNSFKKPTFARWNLQKYYLFYRLHKNSEFHAMFGRNANKSMIDGAKYKYVYNVPGQWQGTYRNVLRVSCVNISFPLPPLPPPHPPKKIFRKLTPFQLMFI